MSKLLDFFFYPKAAGVRELHEKEVSQLRWVPPEGCGSSCTMSCMVGCVSGCAGTSMMGFSSGG